MARRHKSGTPGRGLLAVVRLFFFSAFLLLALKDMSTEGFILAVAVPLLITLGTSFLGHFFPTDRLLLTLTNFLCALGVLVLYSLNPVWAQTQAVAYGIGILCMIVCIYLVRLIRVWTVPVVLMIPASLALLLLPVFFGELTNGAKNWIHVGGISVQPSEIVKLSLVLCLSWLMSRRRFVPWVLFAGACLLLLLWQADLGTALLYFGTAVLLYYAASGNLAVTLLGVGGGAAAAWWGYGHFAHVRIRVAIWRSPWSDCESAGYQIVQGLIALASGGWWGEGLGLGAPTAIPEYSTDYIFAVLCEQFGLIFGLCVLALYVAILWRGVTIAMAARRSFHGLLAMGCTLMLGLQTFTIIGGVLKLIPLTGVTLPFVSRGGTSLASSMCLVGLLQGVAGLNEDALQADTHMAMLGSEVRA